ncbi:hypothetical protein [Caldimonas tepidiphila]|uniref:hypothetical protein n=1 Tax=Caldimonas tepidiphila TaxID=2315841 RepID=UPI000E5B2BA1|nr:hypothetical protein [Caldimonas tepidiphila]
MFRRSSRSPLPRSCGAARCLAFVAAAVLAQPASAGRPLVTDDAGVVPAGACQLELFSERLRDERANWAVPACNPFGNTEIGVGIGRGRDEAGESRRLSSWQLKTVLREHEGERAGFGLMLLDRRDRAVHRGRLGDTELKGLATLPLRGEDLLVHANLGWLRERDGEAASRGNAATWATALDWQIVPGVRGSLEGYGSSGERPSAQFGLRHELVPGHVQIDASVGAQFGRSRESRFLTIGLVFVTPSLLR